MRIEVGLVRQVLAGQLVLYDFLVLRHLWRCKCGWKLPGCVIRHSTSTPFYSETSACGAEQRAVYTCRAVRVE